jgi:HPt (histidine-containing phosphotransfer) domain-containing protein
LALDKDDARGAKSGTMVPALESHAQTFADLKSAGFDPDALWRRVDGDLELLQELIAVFEKETPDLLARIGTAAGQDDVAGLERSAHKIKGSLLQFSAEAAAAAALRLEEMGKGRTLAGAEEKLHVLRHEIDLLLQSLHAMTQRIMASAPDATQAGPGKR